MSESTESMIEAGENAWREWEDGGHGYTLGECVQFIYLAMRALDPEFATHSTAVRPPVSGADPVAVKRLCEAGQKLFDLINAEGPSFRQWRAIGGAMDALSIAIQLAAITPSKPTNSADGLEDVFFDALYDSMGMMGVATRKGAKACVAALAALAKPIEVRPSSEVVERYRAALEKIAEGEGIDWAHKPTDEMQDIARAALASVPDKGEG